VRGGDRALGAVDVPEASWPSSPFPSAVARRSAAACALGGVAPDTVVAGGSVFNVFTGAFEPDRDIWIKDGLVARCGPPVSGGPAWDSAATRVIDACGAVVVPGLIDGHTHLPDAVGIEEFVRYVIPSGTTTLVTELMEVGMVGGEPALRAFTAGLSRQPIRLFYTVPTLASPVDSGDRPLVPPEVLASFLDDSWCLGVGEVYWGSLLRDDAQGARMRGLCQEALARGKVVEGHSAGASGDKLLAYTALGPSSCHEAIDEVQARERLAAGLCLMVREGGVRQELAALRDLLAAAVTTRRLVLVTDSVDPTGLLERGYLDVAVRQALRLGLAPELVYRMVTLNVAEHFRIDHLVGSLAPGRWADLVVIPAPSDFRPELVMCRGRVVFRQGEPPAEPVEVSLPAGAREGVHPRLAPLGPLGPLGAPGAPGSLGLPGPFELPREGRARVLELVSRLVTRETVIELDGLGGCPDPAADVLLAVAVDRFGSGEGFVGLLKGYGLRRGACVTSITWDTTDCVGVAADELSLRTALRRLEEIGGGAVYAVGGEVAAELAAPVYGLIMPRPLPVVVERLAALERALFENGVPWERPLLSLNTLTTAAIPHLRISRLGYVRLKDGAVLPLLV
jgi:adenine deaminase